MRASCSKFSLAVASVSISDTSMEQFHGFPVRDQSEWLHLKTFAKMACVEAEFQTYDRGWGSLNFSDLLWQVMLFFYCVLQSHSYYLNKSGHMERKNRVAFLY